MLSCIDISRGVQVESIKWVKNKKKEQETVFFIEFENDLNITM